MAKWPSSSTADLNPQSLKSRLQEEAHTEMHYSACVRRQAAFRAAGLGTRGFRHSDCPIPKEPHWSTGSRAGTLIGQMGKTGECRPTGRRQACILFPAT